MKCEYCQGDKYINIENAYQEYDEGWSEYMDCDASVHILQIENIKYCPMCGQKLRIGIIKDKRNKL